ncbi:MAG: glycosyltransferase, partial [Nitrosopumilaceae archaeon]|nr:glycosyltransferase [Nitrosopumilaceae archaeon]
QKGDWGRNQYLLNRLQRNQELFHSDRVYLSDLLGIPITSFNRIYVNVPKVTPKHESNRLANCHLCNLELKLDQKTVRDNSNWYHLECFRKLPAIKKPDQYNAKPKQEKKSKKRIRKRPDSVQVLLTVSIFIFLASSVYFLLGTLSVIAMSIGGVLLLYHLFSSYAYALKPHSGRKGPSVFIIVLLAAPFVIGTLIAYEGYTFLETPVRIILLVGMTISFWSTMLFVPTAVYSKYREELQPEPTSYPLLSILIPAYNEEKVIGNTIEAMLETKYPKKQIIVIDDGSTDKTLSIVQRYKDQVTILHKENGGKASALNYGLVYAKGDIIVIVDADTIIGRNSLKEIIKGFDVDERVAAVAGNIKIRNKINWITKCQALEYITGIQIVRRAFDIFGTITIVPGALGAFKRELMKETGSYQKATIVEDFDATVKLLKSGLITQGSTKSTAYTEAPSTLDDFAKQRKRWYRGNIQVLTRHSDALTNPRYGYLQKLAFPYLLLGMIFTPIIGFVSAINAIIGIALGDGWYVLQIFLIFTTVHYMMTALALRIDEEKMGLLTHAGFLVVGFKQIVDFLLLKAILEHLFKRKAIWTSAKRTGVTKNETK